jgi:hypothetical protein
MKKIRWAVTVTLLASGMAWASGSYNTAALANAAGVSQAEVTGGVDWLQSDANSDTGQNSSVLQTGNALGGQAQVQGSLANSQVAAAVDPAFASVMARYYGLYNQYYDSYMNDLSLASGASSAYATCVAAQGADCLNSSGYYSGLAQTAYGQYQYYYGLWNEDYQQQQAMLATAGQQSVLSGASAQTSQQDYQSYQNAENTANAAAQASASDTVAGNAGNNTTAAASGAAAANQALGSIQTETGVQQGQAVAVTGSTGSGFTYSNPSLQNQMTNLATASVQNAQTAVIQQGYANNRASDATTAVQQGSADGAASAVAPTPESQAMWGVGAALANSTANTWQQDANQTMAVAQQAQQGFVQDQTQANADAIQMGQDTSAAASAYANQQAAQNGVTFAAPSMNTTAVQQALAQQETAMNNAQTAAEVSAGNSYSQQQIAQDAQNEAATAQQQQEADQANASGAPTAQLQTTWKAAANSYGNSASQDTQAALAATSAANTDAQAANAEEQQAEGVAGNSGINTAAANAGTASADAALSAIQRATGVQQGQSLPAP